MNRRKQRLKALHKARRAALPPDRLDTLLGHKTVAQIQAEAREAQLAERRAAIQEAERQSVLDAMQYRHEWDEDGCCIHCNLDGCDWPRDMQKPLCDRQQPPLHKVT